MLLFPKIPWCVSLGGRGDSTDATFSHRYFAQIGLKQWPVSRGCARVSESVFFSFFFFLVLVARGDRAVDVCGGKTDEGHHSSWDRAAEVPVDIQNDTHTGAFGGESKN